LETRVELEDEKIADRRRRKRIVFILLHNPYQASHASCSRAARA